MLFCLIAACYCAAISPPIEMPTYSFESELLPAESAYPQFGYGYGMCFLFRLCHTTVRAEPYHN